MKTPLARRLPAAAKTPIRTAAIAGAGLAFVGCAVAGPWSTAAQAAPAPRAAAPGAVRPIESDARDNPSGKDKPSDKDTGDTQPGGGDGRDGRDGKADAGHDRDRRADDPDLPAADELDYRYEAQPNFFYCGPAATRIALSTRGHTPSQDEVAAKLGTTTDGTPSAEDTTRVLNAVDGTDFYRTTAIPGQAATPAEMDRLQADVVHAIGTGHGMVVNIIGAAVDTDGIAHAYPGGHYLAVVGYSDHGRTVTIADPADVDGQAAYRMSTIALAHWIASRGYSA